MRRLFWQKCLLLLVLAALAGCGREPAKPLKDEVAYEPVALDSLPGWASDRQEAALQAFVRSCARIARRADDAPMGLVDYAGTAGAWRSTCRQATELGAAGPDDARHFFATGFRAYRVTAGGSPTGLFTGYYEALLRGARTSDERFSTPIYQRPVDLVNVDLGAFMPDLKGKRIAGRVEENRLVPYPDRAAIDRGALEGRVAPLLWVDDPIEAFFLQIQGSGQVEMADGSRIRIGYADQNGRAYRAIGKDLIEMGAIPADQVSLQSIRAWLRAHPEQAGAVMEKNPSYVFFRETGPVQGDLGPVGGEGVPLTPGRSLAVDRHHVAYGTPIWLDTTEAGADGQRLQRLMVAQDTGGAIRGPIRGDVFWGAGQEAEERAGRMRDSGSWYILLPKDLPPPGTESPPPPET